MDKGNIQIRRGEPVFAKDDPVYRKWLAKIETEDLKAALAMSSDKRMVEFLRLLCVPRPKATATIAKSCGLTLGDLNNFWRDSNMSRARDIAFAGIPQVMADVVTDSSNTMVVCPRCDGLGSLDPGPDYDDEPKSRRKKSIVRECPECDGMGKVKKSGDIESRKLLFETTGMTGKKGPMIAIQNNSYGPSSLETFVDNFDKMDAAVTGKDMPMIEGETEPIA